MTMNTHHKGPRHEGHEDVTPEVTTEKALNAARADDARKENFLPDDAKKPNIIIGTFNVFGDGMKALGHGIRVACDPVLKVCYPVIEKTDTAVRRMVIDPVKNVCYPPLKSHWERKYKGPHGDKAHYVLIFDLALMFLLGALIVGLIFMKFVLPAIPLPDVVQVHLDEPETVTSGEPTSIVIAYSNDSGEQFAGAEIRVQLPEQFLPTAVRPAGHAPDGTVADKDDRFITIPIGMLEPRSRGSVTIDGALHGPLNSEHAVISELSYWKEGAIAPERSVAAYDIVVTASPFMLDLSFDEPFLRGSQNVIRIAYANDGDSAIEDAEIRLSAPPGFVFRGSVPAASASGVWTLGTLAPGEKGVISVYGVLPDGALSSFIVRAYADADGMRLLTQEARGDVDARSTGFVVGNDLELPNILRAGETFTVRVRYHNNGQFTLKNAAIRLVTSERYLANEPVEWTGGDLESIGPGENGVLTATLRVKDVIATEDLAGDQTPVIRVQAVGEYGVEGDPTRTFRIDGAANEAAVITTVGIEGAALYRTKDGEQLGVGPIPPNVGDTTELWVVLKVSNTTGAVRDGRLEAILPPGVQWTGRYSVTAGEPIAYLSEQRRIIWDIGAVPAFSEGEDAGASIEVRFTPIPEDAGTAPALLRDITLVAHDAATGARVHATAPDVTTAVRFGSAAETAGIVTKN